MLENMIKSLKHYVLLQYLYMVKTGDFGEAGPLRVKHDFARYFLGLSPQHIMSVSELDNFTQEFERLTFKYQKLSELEIKRAIEAFSFDLGTVQYKTSEVYLINQALAEAGYRERLFMGARKEGFAIMLFGPVNILERDGHTIYILENEIVCSPAAVKPMAAITNSQQEIIVRKASLEYIFWKKWAQGKTSRNPYAKPTLLFYGIKKTSDLHKIKKLFIGEMLETTIVHELCHAAISENFSDQNLMILAKLMSAIIPDCPLSALDELLAEWMPPQVGSMGVVPHLAHLAQKNPAKAKRMLFRYLADSWFAGAGEEYMQQTGDLLISSVKPYIKDWEVDFSAIIKDNNRIYDLLMGIFQKYLNLALNRIRKSEFSYNGLTVSFNDLARTQHRKFEEQDKNIDKDSAFYKRYFWANMLNYLKNCSKDTFSGIIGDMGQLSRELHQLVFSNA